MERRNDEEGFVERWFGGGPGPYWSVGILSAAVGFGLSHWWNRRQKAQLQRDLQRDLQRNRLVVKNAEGDRNYTVQNSVFLLDPSEQKDPKDERLIQVERVFFNLDLGKVHRDLNKLEDLLMERQHIYCSYFKPRSQRLKLEEQMMPLFKSEEMKLEFENVLLKDRACGSCLGFVWSGDKRRNGREMWTLLDKWRAAMMKEVEGNRSMDFRSPVSDEKKK